MTEGVFRPGSGFLYRINPAVKLVMLLVLAACLFSAVDLWRPFVIALAWGVLVLSVDAGFRDLWRVMRMLRWLLLFTLILHLFFTPGRTLLGVAWLSYDGLMRGLVINSQLLLAVLFSLLLSWTTPPAAMARGLEVVLAPLKLFRVPVRETTGLLLLVLHFFPLIKEEIDGEKVQMSGRQFKGLSMIKAWVARFEPILIRLFDRADQLALDIVSGNRQFSSEGDAVPKVTRFDIISFIVGVGVLLMFWQV